MIEVRWEWEEPHGFQLQIERRGSELIESVESPERVRTDAIVRRFIVEDAFGLARVAFRKKQERIVEVLPWAGRLVAAR